MFWLKIFNVDDSLKNGMQMGAEIMTLEMRYREKREEGKFMASLARAENAIFQKKEF